MTKYIPLHVHSNASTLDGLSSPEDIARRVVKLGLDGCALTDHATVAGVPSFFKAMGDACGTCGHPKGTHNNNGSGRCMVAGETCQEYKKNKLKAIAGCEFNVSHSDASIQDSEHRRYSHLCVLAKNKEGWKGLIQAVSQSNLPEFHYYKPRLDLERLAAHAKGNWVVFMGHPGSTIADFCFTDYKAAYRCNTVEEVREYVKRDEFLYPRLKDYLNNYFSLFGKENVKLEVQLLDKDNIPAVIVLAEIMRELGTLMGIDCIATPDAHYSCPEDAPDQRVLLCMSLNTNLAAVQQAADNGDDVMLGGFFKSSKYYIPSDDELKLLNSQAELDNTRIVMDSIEKFTLNATPRLPKFKLPDGFTDDFEYLKELCERGWKKKVEPFVPSALHQEYRDRLNYELTTFYDLGVKYKLRLDTYFLIVSDIVRHSIEKLGCYLTPGRGSASGTIIGYLTNIHDTDPIEGKLSFERFFNAGRISETKLALPDIDLDFPVEVREQVKDYIKETYGHDKVSDVATFQTLQGREALTRVLAAHSWGDFKERKFITSFLPQEAEISDKLQEMMENTGEASIIRWALENYPKDFGDYCRVASDGSLEGPLALYFAQAIRLEGCKRGKGRHASGVVISDIPLAEVCPMLYDDKHGDLVAGMEFTDLEQMGLLKIDILGVNIWDKIIGAVHTINTGEVSE